MLKVKSVHCTGIYGISCVGVTDFVIFCFLFYPCYTDKQRIIKRSGQAEIGSLQVKVSFAAEVSLVRRETILFGPNLCCTADFYIFFSLPRYLQAVLVDCGKILHHGRKFIVFYNTGAKIWRLSLQNVRCQKHAKFGTISDDFKL